MKKAHGIVSGIIGPEGVGTDQFRQGIALMGRGRLAWAHLMQQYINARLSSLPSGFRSCEAAADDVQFRCHWLALAGWPSTANEWILAVSGSPAGGELSRYCSTIDATREKFTGERAFRACLGALPRGGLKPPKTGKKKPKR
jgi:hypothetical protein